MRLGKVVSIRINPKDCMSIIDVLDAARVDTTGMSYSSMTALAVSALLEHMRNTKMIPVRDGFEYLKMMSQYIDSPRSHAKLIVADRIQQHVLEHGSPAMEKLTVPDINKSVSFGNDAVPTSDPVRERMVIMWKELDFKRNRDKKNMDTFEKAEWHRLFPFVFGSQPTEFDWDNASEDPTDG